MLGVPRHDLGEEIVTDLAAGGLSGQVYRGREADDPEQPGMKMCLDLERVKLIEEALADVSAHACQHRDHVCEFYCTCGYQRQRRRSPDVWIVPHQLLFLERPKFIKPPDSLAIDESFWSAALHGADNMRRIFLGDLIEPREIVSSAHGRTHTNYSKTADLLEISTRVYRALAVEPGGPIRRAALVSGKITADDLRLAQRLEWRRKRNLEAYPGMPLRQVRSAAARIHAHNKKVANLARFWKLALWTLESNAERSPWLSIGNGNALLGSRAAGPAIYMAWCERIHESWEAPTLLMDATMSGDITRQFFPTVDVVHRVTAPMQHARVRQIVDRAMTADMLIPVGEPDQHPNPTRRANVERIRRFIQIRANTLAPGRVLVICQQGLEAALRDGPLPDTVEIAHFNAITGLNAWSNVRLLLVIGRTEPPVREVERIAGILFETEVQKVQPDENGHVRYPRIRRGIRMRTGRGIAVQGPCHPDPQVEALRWAICEAELIQAIGRARGVNRTAADPLDIDILTNVCLPMEVDEVTTWKVIQPDAIDFMWASGAIPLVYADMSEAYPGLFPSAGAARMALRRINLEQTSIESILYRRLCGVSVVGYRRKGSRGPAGKLYYDPTRIDPLTWLASQLGDCSLLSKPVVIQSNE